MYICFEPLKVWMGNWLQIKCQHDGGDIIMSASDTLP